MKLKTLANKLLMGLAYIPVIIQSTILIVGLGFWIYYDWKNARTVLFFILGVILLLSLVLLISDLIYKRKEYLKFKRGEYPPVIIDTKDACTLGDPPRGYVPLEEKYDLLIQMAGHMTSVPTKYISDLTIKGKMPVKSLQHILKMKNLSSLNMRDVKLIDCPDSNILEDIFRDLTKLELLIPPSPEYWGIENGQD
ncbi:hypothetical protein LJC52_04435 [Bacteroidales bacterium OttesenSCG-928-A17]|nr:hypothetical protein [Bacteroidales bacterium OttesenSCG-928-A17]